MVVVPTEEDWKKRLELRKEVEGDDVPESIMLEMKGGLKRSGSGVPPLVSAPLTRAFRSLE